MRTSGKAKIDIATTPAGLDNPIELFEEDFLHRGGFVKNLARIVADAPVSGSTVFALCADWGSGKTSVKNLLKLHFAKDWGTGGPLVVEFNPWAFSGQDQVLEAFFSEVGKAIGREHKGEEAAKGFKELGAHLTFGATTAKNVHLWLDLFGIPGAKLFGVLGEALGGAGRDAKEYGESIETVGKKAVTQIQQDLVHHLASFNRNILIILDDLDRLTPDQLLLVFQIVKANASLPRINYLLLMDRPTVERHLQTKHLGPNFVEKIVQFEFTLPHVPTSELKRILAGGFEAIVAPFRAEIDWERWEYAWTSACQHVFTTLRKIKRFLHTLRFHIRAFVNDGVLEVDPTDLFLLEVLRLHCPLVHQHLPNLIRPLIIHDDGPDSDLCTLSHIECWLF
jgi:predicted KAP-like P-loop ATPase